jgi:hypothetical protein
MAQLEYKSLVTKETIDYYLSKIKDNENQKDLISTVSKFDIRISTKPVIDVEYEEFYYKIWIWRRGTKKRAHIKLYNRLELLKEEQESKKTILLPSLGEILCWIRTYANVPEDFEEYCEITWRDPSDETSRTIYPRHLKRAERFKKFITKEEIKSIPAFLPCYDKDQNIVDDDEFYDLDDDKYSVPLDSISLKDKRECDKLEELRSNLDYNLKIVKSYGYDPYTGDYDLKKFPITKEDKQEKNIDKDFDNYNQALEEYRNYLKELIKKYDIKPTGNLVQRLTFRIPTNYNDDSVNSKQPQLPNFDFKDIEVAIDWKDFFPDS